MAKRTRQEKLDDGQMYNGFDLKGVRHKPLTAGSYKFLQRIKSPIYTRDFVNADEMDIILQYLFATSTEHNAETLNNAVSNWDIVVMEYADKFNIKEITDPKIIDCILRDIQNQDAACVEVREDADSEKKTKATNPIG